MNTSVMSRNGKAAQAYASKLGWAVFPLHTPIDKSCSCNNPNCKSIGKHPRIKNGLKAATTKIDIIRTWWGQWPSANIGVVTGGGSGFVALDVDPRHGGNDSLRKLNEKYGQFPATIEAITGGGGSHILFKHSGYIKNRTNILPGLDIRGDGGYIVVSPSLHLSGNKYEWELSSRPLEVQLTEMPDWLLQKITESEQKQKRKPDVYWLEVIQGVGEGERNTSAASLAGYLLRHGISAPVAYELMLLWNERNNPPESVEVIETTFHSILNAELKRLRGGRV
ncbi:bifunctional DNA primase/polymerase [Halobacillus sp. BBL2006]|uniref:bifunctional DNA primase/polymerase n=1 Tax=Halobacillus sp. BBL2006 TaxID=1543706 RepID=UPI000690ED6C|nr:bifunctional DNA primase/polymerase [Halobacillus sp. BBL2006]